jgi:lambda repressor-like predicted transcriptional regulator
VYIYVLFCPRNALQIVQMGEHRGKILENAIREKGYSLSAAAKRMNISRRTLYNYFDDPDLAWEKIIQFDKQLILGLPNKFTEMGKYIVPESSDGGVSESENPTYWKNKYIDLLEKYTKLLEKTS